MKFLHEHNKGYAVQGEEYNEATAAPEPLSVAFAT
jgi:hypothetical protein